MKKYRFLHPRGVRQNYYIHTPRIQDETTIIINWQDTKTYILVNIERKSKILEPDPGLSNYRPVIREALIMIQN